MIPATAEEILREIDPQSAEVAALDAQADAGNKKYLLFAEFADDTTPFAAVAAGHSVADSKVLFARADGEALLKKFEEERAAAQAAAQAAQTVDAPEKPEKPEGCAQIGIDDFMGVELRTAQVLACEKVPKAKKLLKLQIDLGYETRQVVSGIAKWYAPEDLLGKKIIVVANLKPAVLCGIESNGMILASGEETVRVIFLDPATPLGERVR